MLPLLTIKLNVAKSGNINFWVKIYEILINFTQKLKKVATLKVESFAGTKVRGYKLSRMKEILGLFSYFRAVFCYFLIDISRMNSKVRFRGY